MKKEEIEKMKEEIKQLEKEIFSILDHLHQENGEISWKEVNTTQFIKDKLGISNCSSF